MSSETRIKPLRHQPPIPSGYVLGRTSDGTGDAELIPLSDLGRELNATGTLGSPTAGLQAVSSGHLLSNLTGSTAIPTGHSVSATLDYTLGSTQGQIIDRDASAGGVLDPGTPGQFLKTLGAAANPAWATVANVLSAIADGSLLANTSGGSAVPVATTLTAMIDYVMGSAQGDLLYRNASGWVVLAPGTSGQFLKTLGAAANPAWASVGAGGSAGGLFNQVLSATPTSSSTGLSTVAGAGAAIADTATGLLLTATAGGAVYTASVPATPYTITALLVVAGPSAVGALGWTDGTKYHFIYNGTTSIGAKDKINVQKNSAVNTFSGTDYNVQWGFNGGPAWVQVTDDGTNAIFRASADGANFFTAFSVAKAAGYLGAGGYTRLFIGTPGGGTDCTLVSWA